MKEKVKGIAFLSCLLGIALMLSFLEAILPLSIILPGFKLGLANVIILLCLKYWGLREALLINIARILLSALLFGNILSLALSLSGGIASTLLMCLLLKSKKLSDLGVSSAGGAIHNFAQILAAMLMLSTSSIFRLAPFLLILGGITGVFCGILSVFLEKRINFQKISRK